MEENYSKREVDMIVDSVKQHISDTVVPTLNRIEAQTIKTNGRVSKLEVQTEGFVPVKKIVYSGVSLILTSVLGALIYLVLK